MDTSPSSCRGYSNIESVTVTLRPAPPSLTLPESSDTGNYTANWNSVGGAELYRLEEKVGSGNWTEIETGSATSRAFNDKALGLYSYRVRACLNTLIESCSEFSDIESISVTPATPILFVPTGSSTGNYTISWSTVSGATRYRLDEKVETGSWSQILEGSATRSEEHTSELQSLMRISYADFCL